MKRCLIFAYRVLALCTLFACVAFGQSATTGPASDPHALALAAQALVALGASQVNDVTLTGSVTRVVGPDEETGTFTLKALGLAQSRMDLTIPSGTLSEVRTNANGSPQGFWSLNGVARPIANHNCSTDAVWFFPQLSVLGSQSLNPNSLITYIGQETRGGRSVQHLHYYVQGPASNPTDLGQHLSVEDIYLDSSSLLLVALAFNAHPDNNAAVDIPVELDFFDYRAVSGVNVPFRIQKIFNGSLLLDLTVQSAVLNSGLTNSAFTAQ